MSAATSNGQPTADTAEFLRYRHVMAAAGIGIWEMDLTTNDVVWDDHCRMLFGLPTDGLIPYAEAIQFIHPDDRARVDAAVRDALAGKEGGRYDQSYRTQGPDGVLRYVRFTGQAEFDGAGAAIHFSGVAQDTTNWMTIQTRAESVERIAQTALESTGAGWYRIAMPDGAFEHSPELARIMTGNGTRSFSRDELAAYIHPDDRTIRQAAYEVAGKTDHLDYTVRFCWADDSVHWVRVTGRYHRNAAGAIHLFTGTAQDVTESRQTEEALRQSERRFRSIFNGQFLFLAILSPDGRVMDINELPLKAVGSTREEILGKFFWDTPWWRDLPDMSKSWPRRLSEAAKANGPVFSEDRFQTETGDVRIADASITAVKNAGGAVEFFIVQASDVTERKAAEEALRQSEDRYQSFVRQSTDGIWRFEIDEPIPVTLPAEEQIDRIFSQAILAECNDAFARMYGYQRGEELVEKHVQDFMPRDESAEAYIRHFIESDYRIAGLESKEVDRHGRELYLMNNLIGIVEDGKVQRAWGTQRNITEERQRAAALRESEARFRSIIEQAPISTCVFEGPEFRITLANEPMIRTLGKGPDVLGKPLAVALPELADQPFLGILKNVYDTGKTFEAKAAPARIVVDGVEETHYFDITFKALRSATGEVYGILDMSADVTVQVLAMQKIGESRDELEFAIDAAELGTWDLDPSTMRFSANARLKGWFGLLSDEEIRLEQAIAAIVEEDRARVQEAIRWAIQPGSRGYDEEYTIINPKTGIRRIVRAKGKATFANDDTPLRFNGTLQDLTQEVTARKAIEESEAYFRRITDTAPVILWMTRPDFYCTYLNPHWYEFTGQSHEDALGLGWLEATHPDDKERTAKIFTEANEKREPCSVLYRLRTADGSYRWAVDSGSPRFAEDGTYEGMIGTVTDVHEQIMATEAVKQSEEKFRSVIETSPAGIGLFIGRDLVIESPNQALVDIVGKGWDIVGKPLREAMPELITEGQPFLKILDDVFTTGIPFETTGSQVKIVQNGVMTENYYNFTYTPLRDAEGKVYAILDIAIDVTEQVKARQAAEESEAFSRGIIQNSPVSKLVFEGEDMIVRTVNPNMLEMLGRDERIIGRPFMEVAPGLRATQLLPRLRHVLHTGDPFHIPGERMEFVRHGKPYTGYFNYSYQPLRNAAGDIYGVICTANEVTELITAQERIAESEQKLRSMVEGAPFPIGVYIGHELRIQLANRAIIKTWGKGNDIVGKTYPEVLPELDGTGVYEQLRGVLDTGRPYHARNQRVDLVVNGVLKPHYFNYSFTPLHDAEGKVYGVMNTAADVTRLVLAKQQVEEAEAALRSAIELAELGTWEMNAATGAADYSERLRAWIGVKEGEEPLAAFMDAVHPDDRTRVASSLQRALKPDSDGHYDEEYRLVNRFTGRQRVIHAQGRTVVNEEGVARISGTAQDITKERALQAELERQVAERTAELASANNALTRSNEELSQYAYVASHDLQEPLRKIRMFSGILESQEGLPPSAEPVIGRISQAAERMSGLIQSLLEFSRLLNSEAMKRPVNLNDVVGDIVRDFELLVSEKDATIHVGSLPTMEAVALQMNQLFYNLIGNALKFSKPDAPPEIRVESKAASPQIIAARLPTDAAGESYYHITVADNGIGFETRYADQIFEVFKRLHTREVYPGSGIGLALCRRIVDNHGGALWAESTPGAGTTFNILLPGQRA